LIGIPLILAPRSPDNVDDIDDVAISHPRAGAATEPNLELLDRTALHDF
jgi:hypothetical protein